MTVRIIIVTLAFLALVTPSRGSIVAGHDYVVLDAPQRQEVKGRIEVIEYFSWGCPHCYEFYPLLTRWLATLPKDVTFKRVNSVGQAQQTVIDYRVDGIPTLAIGGRYKASDNHTKMLAVADELITKVRAEEKKPAK
jgi:thiol-disulfide isomerase/thioredoxin